MEAAVLVVTLGYIRLYTRLSPKDVEHFIHW